MVGYGHWIGMACYLCDLQVVMRCSSKSHKGRLNVAGHRSCEVTCVCDGMELLLGHYCADALAAPRLRPRTVLLAPHLRHASLAAVLSEHGMQTLRHRILDAQCAFERTDDAPHRHAVAVVLPCNGH